MPAMKCLAMLYQSLCTENIWLGTGPQLLNYPRNHFCWLRKACPSWSLLGYSGGCIPVHPGDAGPGKVGYENRSGTCSQQVLGLADSWSGYQPPGKKPLCWPKTVVFSSYSKGVGSPLIMHSGIRAFTICSIYKAAFSLSILV